MLSLAGPRGGMPIDVFWQTGEVLKGIWLPDQRVAPYRGRGVKVAEPPPIGAMITRLLPVQVRMA